MNLCAPKLSYVSGVSWPRSGHHLLVRLLKDYFGENFKYCEFYREGGCCKISPCARQPEITFSKNHDYDASANVKAGHTYLVQYRRFLDSLVSDFELHVRNVGVDTEKEFRRFAQRKLTKYKFFMHRWATVKASHVRFVQLSYESLTTDPMLAMQNIIPFFAPGVPVDEERLATVIANVSQITVSDRRVVRAEEKGVAARRDIQLFRHYDFKFFQRLERESERAYNRMTSLPLLRQYHEKPEPAAMLTQEPTSLYIDVTGMGRIGVQQSPGISRIESFLVRMALADTDSAIGVVVFDSKLLAYRHLGRAELARLRVIQERPPGAVRVPVSSLLREMLSLFNAVKEGAAEDSMYHGELASQIFDRSVQRFPHSVLKRIIQLICWWRSRLPLKNTAFIPLDLSSSVVLHLHIAVFGDVGFHDALGVKMQRAFVCHDLIPWKSPDYVINPALARRFVTRLKLLAEIGFHALSISNATNRDLSSFITSIGSAHVRQDHFPMPSMLHDIANQLNIVSSIEAREPFILYCSVVESRKNHILLARVWKRALEEGIVLPKLVCVGRRGLDNEALDAFLDDYPEVRSQIEFRGMIGEVELINLYRTTIFGVMPSFDEGWGLPVSECLDFGTPIIVSNIPVLVEASGGLMPAIDPFDEDGWLENIKHLSNDASSRKNLRDAIRERYRRVTPQESWATIKSRLLN